MEYLIGGIFISVAMGLLPVMIQFKSQVNNGAFNKLIKIKRFSFLFCAPGQDPVSKIGVALPIFISQLLGYVLLVVFTTLNILFYFISEEMFITMMTITIYVFSGEAIILVIFDTILLLLSRPKEYFKRRKIDRKKITYSDYIDMLLFKKSIRFWYNENEYRVRIKHSMPEAVTVRATDYSNGEVTHKYEEKFSPITDMLNNFRIDGKLIIEICSDINFEDKMSIQSFYFSVKISEEDKTKVLLKLSKDDIKSVKLKFDDFTYKNTLYIDNVPDYILNEVPITKSWWHINAGLYDFFHSCEILYEFCQNIDTIKPNFTFDFLGKQYEFKFPSLMDFISFIYPKIEIYKKNLEKTHGVLSIPPNKFFNFKRKNQKFFR